jgi:8-oxo-dGTP pyrophosphatase MutT (NUDIX family)
VVSGSPPLARRAPHPQTACGVAARLTSARAESTRGGDWAEAARSQLDEERLSAQLDCHAAELRLGRHHRALGELRTLVAATHPLDERTARQLMTALYRSERQGEALQCYEAIRRRLQEELGVDPGPELRALHRGILRSDSVLTDPARRYPDPPLEPWPRPDRTPRPVPAELPRDISDVHGRTRELAQLDALLSAGGDRSPTPPLITVSGSAGVGKTALVVHWAHRVRRRFPDGQL